MSGPDGKPDGKIDADDRTWIGVNEPKFAWGLNIQLTWKNFDFAAFFNSEIGRQIASATKSYTDFFGFFGGQNYGKRVLDSWSPTNTSSTIPAITAADINQENRFSTYFVENTSYMKLQSVVIGYHLPEALRNNVLKSARVFIQEKTSKHSGCREIHLRGLIQRAPVSIIRFLHRSHLELI